MLETAAREKWWVAVLGVYPDLTPCPTPNIALNLPFGDDEAAAREWFAEWEGDAVLYRAIQTMGDLGRTVVDAK